MSHLSTVHLILDLDLRYFQVNGNLTFKSILKSTKRIPKSLIFLTYLILLQKKFQLAACPSPAWIYCLYLLFYNNKIYNFECKYKYDFIRKEFLNTVSVFVALTFPLFLWVFLHAKLQKWRMYLNAYFFYPIRRYLTGFNIVCRVNDALFFSDFSIKTACESFQWT